MKTCLHLWQYLSVFVQEWEMLQTGVKEKIKTHILYWVTFFQKLCLWGNAEKCHRARQVTDQNIIWHLHFAFRIKHTHTNTHTHSLSLITLWWIRLWQDLCHLHSITETLHWKTVLPGDTRYYCELMCEGYRADCGVFCSREVDGSRHNGNHHGTF